MIRKLICTILALLFLSGNMVFAQRYNIGGSFSLSGGINQTSSTDELTNRVTLSVSPDFGWNLVECWAVGVRPSFGFSQASYSQSRVRVTSLGINPYARYRMLEFKHFGLWAEADSELNRNWNQHSIERGTWSTESRSFSYSIRLLPVLAYQFNRHVSLESRLNLFSVALSGEHVRYSPDKASNSFSYGFQATTDDIFGPLEKLSIGFLYHF